MASLYVACENTCILDLRSVIHEVTTSHQPVFDLLHGAGQDQHSCIPCWSDLVKNAPITSV